MYSIDNEYARASLPGEDWEERYGELRSRDDLENFSRWTMDVLPLHVRDLLWEIKRRYPHCPTLTSSEEVEPIVMAVDDLHVAVRDEKPWQEVLHCARGVVKALKESCFWAENFMCLREDDGDDW